MTSQRKKQQKHTVNIRQQSLFQKAIGHVQKGWKTTLYILGIFAIMAGAMSFLPKISVTPSELLDPSNPFSAPFIISNEGVLPFHSVSYRVHIREVQSEDGAKVIIYKKGITISDFLISNISPGEKATTGVPFPFKFQTRIKSADITFVVIYRPDWLPWHGEQRFRFGLAKKSNNSWTWLPRAMSE
jgi:hypothetical protein